VKKIRPVKAMYRRSNSLEIKTILL